MAAQFNYDSFLSNTHNTSAEQASLTTIAYISTSSHYWLPFN